MQQVTYDAIVLGIGGVGSAALWRLAERGLRVLGIDRFFPPHEMGSSHGQTRIIRQAYFEHPDYVPLLLASYQGWEELEQLAGLRLKRETGLLQGGPAGGVVVPGVTESASRHGLNVEQLSAEEIEHRWPAFRVPYGLPGVFERRAGFLHVERCVQAALDAARAAGAEMLCGTQVYEWSSGDDVVVRTSQGDFSAGRIVIAAGPWAGDLLGPLGIRLEVRRKALMWYATIDRSASAEAGCPCFLFELPSGVFYGFPAIDDRGFKAAEHSGGEPVADPLEVDRSLRLSDQSPVDAFLNTHVPVVTTPCHEHAVCLYTMSPDENFIVDAHPDDRRIVFAAGLSGHGFKFATALGGALADLAVDGETPLPIGFLSLSRFAR
jgi:monomeric sarcosine oxidase